MNDCESRTENGFHVIALTGEVDLSWSSDIRRHVLSALADGEPVLVELSDVTYIDSSGIAALVEGYQTAKRKDLQFGLVSVSARGHERFVARPSRSGFPDSLVRHCGRSMIALIGGARRFLEDVGYAFALLVESLYWVVRGRSQGQTVRPAAVVAHMVETGVRALPIVGMLAFAVGVSLAIQLIATLSEFGAESQVVLAIAKGVTREFAPLITGIVVAGRTASALAARIGSMVVAQEVDALRVMGVTPCAIPCRAAAHRARDHGARSDTICGRRGDTGGWSF